MPVHLYIDADACPVKDEAIRVATRYGVNVTLVSNQGMRPIRAIHITQVVVGAKFDEADDWIAEHISANDIVVTADIKLAARCIDKQARALKPNGHVFTAQNIGAALAMRDLSAHLRETGESKGHNPSFTAKDRSAFLQALDKLIQKS